MTMRLRVILLVMVVVLCVYIVRQIHRRKLNLNYSLLWLALALLLLISAAFPQIIYSLSDLIGLGLPINMVLLVFGFFTLIMLFYLTRIVSQLHDKIRTLTQNAALLEKRIRELEAAQEEHKE